MRPTPAPTLPRQAGARRAGSSGTSLSSRFPARTGQHLILVTATPHSGNPQGFRSLLTLLRPDFAELPENLSGEENRKHREELAKHFAQRRRGDIRRYLGDDTAFPERKEKEETYQLGARVRLPRSLRPPAQVRPRGGPGFTRPDEGPAADALVGRPGLAACRRQQPGRRRGHAAQQAAGDRCRDAGGRRHDQPPPGPRRGRR